MSYLKFLKKIPPTETKDKVEVKSLLCFLPAQVQIPSTTFDPWALLRYTPVHRANKNPWVPLSVTQFPCLPEKKKKLIANTLTAFI